MAAECVDILFVEDNPIDIALIHRTLKSSNKSFKIIHNGPEALEFLLAKGKFADQCAALPPRLIVLDVHLPRMEGIELLKMIKADATLRDIPVIMFSSRNQEDEIDECYRLGACGYLNKPMNTLEYNQILTQIVDQWLVSRYSVIAATANKQ